MRYDGDRKDAHKISAHGGLFLTLCRFRQNLALPDLAMRFDITKQSAGVIFSTWLERLYLKLSYCAHSASGQVDKPLLITCQQILELTFLQH